MDRDTGEALFARYPTLRRSTASTTKLMTGLLAAESGRLDEMVVVSRNAATVGETTMQAVAGERLTLRELTYGLMLPSGNDAAVAIAEALDNTVAGFADRMNRRAHELGMWDTQFSNPHGLDHDRFYRPDHFSSARDMAVLGSAVGDNNEISRIAGTTVFEVPSRDGRPVRTLRNTLAGLWWYPGLVAGKTGWTERAGQCRVVIASRGGIRLSVALLGSPDDVRELRDLLDYGFATLEARRPIVGPPMVPRTPDDVGSASTDLSDAWERFWATFVTREGMVRTAPGRNDGSSALQGDAMLHAVWMRDREAFDRLWEWTRTRLERTHPFGSTHPKDALYARRWAGGAVTDWSNDAGADQRIAGALMLASRTWREPAYAAAATDTLAAVLEKSAISSNRLGVAFEPTLTGAGQSTVVTTGRTLVPTLMRAFAEGARQGVWHWLIDGTYSTLRRASAQESPLRRPGVPAGLWPSMFGVSRQGLGLSNVGDGTFGRDGATLVAQVAIEARWRSDSGAALTGDRDDRAAQITAGAIRAIGGATALANLDPGARSLLACAASGVPTNSAPLENIATALASNEAQVALDGLLGRWCQIGGPPDLWRVYAEPPTLPTTRNDAVVPPTGNGPWFHDDETGHVVADSFAMFVAANGGLGLTGPPLTDAITEGGRRIQYFGHVILVENLGASGPVVASGAAGRLRAEADGVLARSEAIAVSLTEVPPGRQLVGTSGHTVGGAFAKAMEVVGGLRTLLADPITEELLLDGTVVQYFTGGRLEYVPGRPGLGGEPVRLTQAGALAARDRGWLGDKPQR
jgi:D-alanyl-D-alanine carboxypeptidase